MRSTIRVDSKASTYENLQHSFRDRDLWTVLCCVLWRNRADIWQWARWRRQRRRGKWQWQLRELVGLQRLERVERIERIEQR